MTTCNLCRLNFAQAENIRWKKDGFDIVQCPSCKLIFRALLPTDEELQHIYGDEYFFSKEGDTKGQGYQNYLQDEDFIKTNAKQRIQSLKHYLPFGGNLLDIGCAAGFFLDEARKQGFSVHGVELSTTMAKYCKEKLSLPITGGKFQENKLPEESFNCVTMWDYIEHSINPFSDFRKTHQLLKKGGLLVVATGDIASLVARISGKRWHLLTPRHHNFYFTKHTMTQYLKRAGFEVLSIRYPSSVYSLQYLSYKLRTLCDISPIQILARCCEQNTIGRFKIPLNLWDIMTTYARKT